MHMTYMYMDAHVHVVSCVVMCCHLLVLNAMFRFTICCAISSYAALFMLMSMTMVLCFVLLCVLERMFCHEVLAIEDAGNVQGPWTLFV